MSPFLEGAFAGLSFFLVNVHNNTMDALMALLNAPGNEAAKKAYDQQLQAKDEQIQAKDEQIQAKDEQLQAKDEQIQAKDEQIQAKDEQIQANRYKIEWLYWEAERVLLKHVFRSCREQYKASCHT